MAQQAPPGVSALRALTYRLTTTPVPELPPIAAQISASIWNCRHLLSLSSETQPARETIDLVKTLHTRLGTLLQDRSNEGRWTAVVLVKATVEAGGLEVLSKCKPWVNSLLAHLKRPGPSTTRSLAIITLTRIFVLTWDYSNLVREITTQALTTFLPTCLSNLEHSRCSASEIQATLEAFVTLVPRHPTIFRSQETRLRSILASVLSGRSLQSGLASHYTACQKASAQRLLVSLHHCASKQSSSDKWGETFKMSVQAANATCDRIFRAIQENRPPSAAVEPTASQQLLAGDFGLEAEHAAGLSAWKGVYAGAERLINLLHLIEAHLNGATSAPVSLHIGVLMDLLARTFSVVVPRAGRQAAPTLNNQISRDEREAMFAVLPQIHAAALAVTTTIYVRCGPSALALVQVTIEHILPVFQAEPEDTVREPLFRLTERIIEICGQTMARNDVSELAPILKAACQELLASDEPRSDQQARTNDVKQQLGLPGGQVTQTHPTNRSAVSQAAEALLCTALQKLDASTLAPQLRAQIDRTAVLTRQENMMVSSIMNPVRKHNDGRLESSLMPILAREFGCSPRTEALMRPRMPPVRPVNPANDGSYAADEDEGDVEENFDDDVPVENSVVEAEYEDDLKDGSRAHTEPDRLGDHIAVPQQPSNDFAPKMHVGACGKRRAADSTDTEVSAKRTKAKDVAETLLPESKQLLPGPDLTVVQTTAPTAIASSQATFTTAVPDQPGIGDDDSDLDIPELDPNSDTEPEDATDIDP